MPLGYFRKPANDAGPYTLKVKVDPVEGGRRPLRLLDGQWEPVNVAPTQVTLPELYAEWKTDCESFPNASAKFDFTATSACKYVLTATLLDSKGTPVSPSIGGKLFSTQFGLDIGKTVIVILYFT
jgi:hypothetical protein